MVKISQYTTISTLDPQDLFDTSRYDTVGATYDTRSVSWLNILGNITTDLASLDGPIGIGVAAANASSILDLTSTTKGFLPPRVADPSTIATPAAGLIAYDSTDNELQYWNNSSWVSLTAGGSGTVTSVALSGGTTGLNVSGSPITGSGTMTLSGTLAIANGGTGQTTAQAAIDALTNVAAATNEYVLTKDTGTGQAIFKAAGGGVTLYASDGTVGAGRTVTLTNTLQFIGGQVDVTAGTTDTGATVLSSEKADTTNIVEFNDRAQGRVNTSAFSASAQFEVSSTTRGWLKPRMSKAQRLAIGSPATGLVVYDTDSNTDQIWDGTQWKEKATYLKYFSTLSGVPFTLGASASNQAVTDGVNYLELTIVQAGDYVFHAVVTADLSGTDAKPFKLMLAKNGTVEADSIVGDYMKKNEEQSIQLTYPIDGLVATDVIRVYCNNDNISIDINQGTLLSQTWG